MMPPAHAASSLRKKQNNVKMKIRSRDKAKDKTQLTGGWLFLGMFNVLNLNFFKFKAIFTGITQHKI